MKGTILKSQTEAWDSPNGRVVMHFDQGTSVRILDIQQEWVQFSKMIDGKMRRGYVRKSLVEPVILWKGEVEVRTSLNVRSGPGTSHGVIASFKDNQRVLVLEEVEGEAVKGETGWLEIMHKDGIAFVFKKYVDKTEDAAELASNVDLVDDAGSWGDDADYEEEGDDWADITAPVVEEVKVEPEAEVKEEKGLWDKVTSWF
jgi:hypothetical protein